MYLLLYKDPNLFSFLLIERFCFVFVMQMRNQGLPPFKFEQRFRDCHPLAGKEQSCLVGYF